VCGLCVPRVRAGGACPSAIRDRSSPPRDYGSSAGHAGSGFTIRARRDRMATRVWGLSKKAANYRPAPRLRSAATTASTCFRHWRSGAVVWFGGRSGARRPATTSHLAAETELSRSIFGLKPEVEAAGIELARAWTARGRRSTVRLSLELESVSRLGRSALDEGWQAVRPLCGAAPPSGWPGRMRSR
jgi:hypothetical protein